MRLHQGGSRARLDGPAATLLAPLAARAADAAQRLSWLGDDTALALYRRLRVDPPPRWGVRRQLRAVMRAWLYDRVVESVVPAGGGGTIVELGAGLSTRFERVDDGVRRWIDVDLPPVVALRRRLLTSGLRRWHVAASLLDPTWVARLPPLRRPVCFLLDAVAGYLLGYGLREVLAAILRAWPDAWIALDLGPRHALVGDALVVRPIGGVPTDPSASLRALVEWPLGLELMVEHAALGASRTRSGVAPEDDVAWSPVTVAVLRSAGRRIPGGCR